MSESLQHHLQERVKELTALHGAARLLQNPERSLDEVMHDVVRLLPPAWQYPTVTGGRISCDGGFWATANFIETDWIQREEFTLRDGTTGAIEVAYLEERPTVTEGPFLDEERDLIRSLAEMLRAFFQHRAGDAELAAANERLEHQVVARTAALRKLAARVCLAEERERRQIAEQLHDHLGQGLAVIKMRLQNLRGDAVFGGHDDAISDLISLSDQAIRYTRGLTFELSPPVLYELGLGSALDWLGEQAQRKHGLKVKVKDTLRTPLSDEIKVMFWKSSRELLHNVIKHADAQKVSIRLEGKRSRVTLEIQDDGCGFDLEEARHKAGERFGLFSIEERLHQLGGSVHIETVPGRGTTVRLEAEISGDEP